MSYIPVTLNHFRALKAWADSSNAQVDLDIRTFNLEVKLRNRYYTLKPRFLLNKNGQMAYSTELARNVTGFIGWLPYDILRWDISQDKLLFKGFLKKAELGFPATWPSISDAEGGFLVKQPTGSFGYQISGPYRNVGEVPAVKDAVLENKSVGIDFAEQFIVGTNLKVWFWGATAFYAHVHAYPTVMGDGVSTLQVLIESRLAQTGKTLGADEGSANVLCSLNFQQVKLADILPRGREVWIDFRYGRQYASTSPTAESDNDLGRVNAHIRQQIDAMGVKVGQECLRRFKAPVLYSVDGVTDEAGKVWWLEINSNPILPPDGYPLVFFSLFGADKKS
ncbi:hypothetical protein [Polaromonas aquatica]|uniref:hypothetical protein n=1 Tax=Polaromonas aquatica TaxID=332657 RepID=UPI003D64A458